MRDEYPSHWTDMSNYVVHFSKGKAAFADAGVNNRAYRDMLSILGSGELKPGAPFGIGRKIAPDVKAQRTVCFSEIPPGEWRRLAERRRSGFGIGFTKQLLVERGGGPIWYARKDSPQLAALKDLMKVAKNKPDNPIWSITPMIDAPGRYGFREYEYEWEREWRHLGKMKFKPEDVAFLFIPEHLHGNARSFFAWARRENIGPEYLCPFLDSSWTREQVEEALSSRVGM